MEELSIQERMERLERYERRVESGLESRETCFEILSWRFVRSELKYTGLNFDCSHALIGTYGDVYLRY